jgi:hypothetical protein
LEAALFVFNLVIMLLLVLWSARNDEPGSTLSGFGLFDTKPGAECDHRPRPRPAFVQDPAPPARPPLDRGL